jgi:protein TonB
VSEQQELEFGESQARCGSCGGPAGDGELCPSCLAAFSSVLGKPRLVYAAPVDPPTKASDTPRPPVQTTRVRPELVAVAAVAIVAVVGIPVGARWLRNQVPTADVNTSAPTQSPAVVAEKSPVVHEAASPARAATPEAARVRSEAKAPLPEAARPSRVAATVPSKKKSESSANRSEPVAPALNFSPMAVAPLAPAAAVQPPAPTPQPVVTAEAPAGRLFEPSDVDEAPRVATRVDPQLPGNMAGQRVNDVVVVRILVSQSGHPFRINLLRRSKLGPSVDEAVVAAVKQWTFSPARKRGEIVSCWFNVGVAVAN